MRRSIQSYVEISLSSLDEAGFPSAVNNTFRNYPVRDSVRNEVRNEESWSLINLVSGDAACCRGHRRTRCSFNI
jgi:hypothetical protein